MFLASGTHLGPYEILAPLGAGGMGEVYRARDTRLDRDVAIKILPQEMSGDPVRKQRFEREAKTISSLNHPHICVLHDVGSQDGVSYLVMECVEGETLAKRLEKGPRPIGALKPLTPPALDHAIQRCLEKDPEERWQTARDLAREFEVDRAIQFAGRHATGSADPIESLDGLGAGGARNAACHLLFGPASPPHLRPRTSRSCVYPSAAKNVVLFGGNHGSPVDRFTRRTEVRIWHHGADGKTAHLWVQAIDSVTAQPLPGTEGGTWPFWSPDGRSIGFFSDGKLKKTDASGGPVETLCEAGGGRGATWSSEGTILFAPSTYSPLYRVSESGGTPVAVTKLDEARHESSHRWPYFLPDGQTFLLLVRGDQTGIYAGKLGSQETKFLLATESNAAYAEPGYLLFWRDGSLIAQPFDARNLQLKGRAEAVADHIMFSGGQSFGVFSASQTGVLAVRAGGISGTQLYWFDRNGKQLQLLDTENGVAMGPRLSPDEHKLSVFVSDPRNRQRDIWIHDLSRGVRTRFTFDSVDGANPLGLGIGANMVWSPDGSQIAFSADRRGHMNLYSKQWGGAGEERVLLEDSWRKYPNTWSPDARFLAYQQVDEKNESKSQIWILPLFGDRQPFAFLKSSFRMFGAEFSPDGRWLAYQSNESGIFQVYVAAFPGAETKMQVSPAGGLSAKWRSDGKELFYLDLAGRLMKVDVKSVGRKLELSAPQMLFQTSAASPGIRPFDVTKSGERFIFTTTEDVNPSPSMLIVNWDAKLRKR